VRIAIVAVFIFASATANAKPDAEPVVKEDAVLTGLLYPGGAFVEKRFCRTKRDRYVTCSHLLVGKQEGGTMNGNLVFDLYLTAGRVFRRGRFDVTPAIGCSFLSTAMFLGALLIYPATRDLPHPKEIYTMVPFEITGNVAVGYTFVHKGRFRARAELGVRAHVPVFTDSTLDVPTPRGIGTSFGIGAGF